MGRNLRDAIREAIAAELEEMTATGDASGFGTPYAFSTSKPVSSKKKKMDEAGDPYWPYRDDDSMTPRAKMGHAISTVNKGLNEIEKTLKMNSRLKKEMELPSSDYWGKTNKALVKIEQKMHRIARTVREIRA